MDAFFASVEQRDNPSYRGKALVVGGSPDSRGVVAAASYEARKFGIHSAMPAYTALKKCPELIFVRPRFDVYKEVSDKIREIFHRYTDLVEPLSLDEAYLDVTENKVNQESATLLAREIKAVIYKETELTASAGVSVNKFLAKVASDLRKPDGLFLIPPDQVESFIEQLEIEKFYGVGKVTAERMKKLGINNGSELKTRSQNDLVANFGKAGVYFYNIVRGIDERPVNPNRIRKSIGAERSFASDLNDRDEVRESLIEISKILLNRLEKSGTSGRTLTLKVKYADYQQVTRSRTLLECEPLNSVDNLMKVAKELLDTTSFEEKKVRLLGLAVSNLDNETIDCDYRQLQLTLNLNSGA